MATSGDLQLALLIKANAQQARAELAATQAQLRGVEASARNAGAGFGAYNVSLNDIAASQRAAASAAGETTDALANTSAAYASTAAAVGALGETEEQARARIHAMVQASLAEVDAEKARGNAAREAAAQTTAATAEESKAYQGLAARQTASMQAGTRAFLARAEGLAILEKSKLTTADVARAEQLLGEAVAGGAMSQKLMTDALAKVDASKVKDAIVEDAATKATQANTKANVENAASQKLKIPSRTTYSLSALISDASTGQFSRSRREMAALANETGLLGKIMTPTGLAIGGVVAALGLLAVAFAKGESETAAFNNALILTGGYAGKSSAAMQAMAVQMDALSGVTEHAAAAVVSAVAATGKFYGDQVQMVAKAALQMQQATGQSLDVTIKQFESLGSDPLAGLMKLNDTMHFVTQAVYDQVIALQQQGETEQAAQVAQQALAAAVDTRTAAVRQNLGLLQSAWQGLKDVVKETWDAMLNLGRDDAGATLQRLQQQLQSNDALIRAAALSPSAAQPAMQTYIQGLISDNQQLGVQISKLDGTEGKGAKQLSDSLKAQQALAKAAITPLKTYLQTVANLTAEYKTAIAGAGDDVKAMQLANLKIALAKAQKTYDSATQQHSAKGVKGPNLDALGVNAQVATIKTQLATLSNAWANTQKVLDAQHKAGQVSDQQYYAALLTDLNTYEQQHIAALEAEKAAAQSHVMTQADRIRADQQVAAIDSQITQAKQDAAAKRAQIEADEQKSIDDARKAWVAMEQALGVPVTVNTDQAVEQLRKLQSLFDKLKDTANAPTAEQQQQAIEGTLLNGTQAPGRYRSLNNIPGAANRHNPLAQANADINSENATFGNNETAIGQNYAAEMVAAQGNAQKLAQIQKAYDAASEKEQQRHTQTMNQLSDARYWGELQTASDVFGQLASLASSQNKKVAAIGKAAAITQAMIKTYQAAQSAYAAGMETGGPAAPYIAAAYAAIAVAAGLANVAQIRSQGAGGGYAAGGYTGNAPVTRAVGVVHGREGVLSAPEVDAIGGEAGFNRLRSAIRGYADGGYVHPLANAPSPAELGFTLPASPRMDIGKLATVNGGAARAAQLGVRIVNSIDPEFATSAMNSPAGEKVIMNVLSRNSVKLKQMVR